MGVLLKFTPRNAAADVREKSLQIEILEILACLDGMDSKDLHQHFLCLLHNGLISDAEFVKLNNICQKEKRAT